MLLTNNPSQNDTPASDFGRSPACLRRRDAGRGTCRVRRFSPLLWLFALGLVAPAGAADAPALLDEVNPFVGTQGEGFTYPGAQAPFGMISPSPSTTFANYKSIPSRSGYQYEGKEINGFALTHISGAGLHAAQDFPFMPTVGALDRSPVASREAYKSAFDFRAQRASPGFYSVRLDTPGVDVSLTADTRAALARLVFPAAGEAHIVFAPSHCPYGLDDAELFFDSATNEVTGWAATGGFNSALARSHAPYRVYFAAVFDRPVSGWGVWEGENALPTAGKPSARGPAIAAHVSFAADGRERPVLMKIAVSYVSITNARDNLREIPDWNFARVQDSTRARWEKLLGTVSLAGGSRDDRVTFYTALYHQFLQPNEFDDRNGEYFGFDGRVHRVKPGRHAYANFSLWDTWRTTGPLVALLAPDRLSDMAQSLVNASLQMPNGALPIWTRNAAETGCMGTYPSDPFLAHAYAMGARDFDLDLARRRMVATGRDLPYAGWRDISLYMKHGYIPGHGALNVEFGIADFSIARVCAALGDTANADYFLRRSQGAFALINDAGYVQPRTADGAWVEPFDPAAGTHAFNEGNSAQYTWLFPHNVARLVRATGGPEAFERRLDAFFSRILTSGWNIHQPHYWLANEPAFGVPYLYNWIGRPHKAQRLVREIASHFKPTPKGLVGNDDVGALSALYIFSSLGLYPSIPGVGGFAVTTPLFEDVTLRLAGGKTLRVQAPGTSAERPYIQSATLNGRPVLSSWLSIEELTAKTENHLVFVVGPEPSDWATAPEHFPPSFEPPAQAK